jgi:hypothetical protein
MEKKKRDRLNQAAPEMLEALEAVEKSLHLSEVSDEEEAFFLWITASDRAALLVTNVLKRIREE